MAKKRSAEDISGSTFADLYDVQEAFSRQQGAAAKPMGRPKNKVQRDPTTVYLTREETILLRRLHLLVSENMSSVNKSQIIGLAVELLSEMIAAHNANNDFMDGVRSVDALKRKLKDYVVP